MALVCLGERPALAALALWGLAAVGVALADPETERFEELIARVRDRSRGEPLIVALVNQQEADVLAHYLDSTGEAEIDALDSSGVTAIWRATMAMNTDVVQLLAARNADLDFQKETSGLTPLMVASMNGDISTVDALLKAGAQIDKPATEAGATALALAFQSGRRDAAKFLLERGARIDLSAMAWKNVVRLMLHSKRDVDEDLLDIIQQAVEANESNKVRFETLVWGATYAEGKQVDEEEDDSEDFDKLPAPGDGDSQEL